METEKRRHAMMDVEESCSIVVMMPQPVWSEAVVPWNGCGQGGVLRKRIRRTTESELTVEIEYVS